MIAQSEASGRAFTPLNVVLGRVQQKSRPLQTIESVAAERPGFPMLPG